MAPSELAHDDIRIHCFESGVPLTIGFLELATSRQAGSQFELTVDSSSWKKPTVSDGGTTSRLAGG
jgi:hypothetical protein